MPDFAMCKGIGCAKRDECLRFRAVPDRYQTYFAPTPVHCMHFVQIHALDTLKSLERDTKVRSDG